MNKLIIIITLLFAGCSTTVPVVAKFPDAPNELKQTCPDLNKVDVDDHKLSSVLKTVTKNYEQYKECKIKVDSWNEWYIEQKKLFDSIK
jgi:alpha-L-arabinofuranosidase